MRVFLCKQARIFLVAQLILVALTFHALKTFAHTPHDVIDLLEISPNYYQDETLFVVVLNGLLRSIDGGFSWKQVEKGLDNKSKLSSIAISPAFSADSTLFVSTEGDGIYKSQDRGSSWFKVNRGLGDLNVHLLAISSDYSSDKTVLAAGHNGALFKTKNGGGSWYQVMDDEIKVTAIVFCKGQNKSNVLVGDQNGILYRSTDSADNWRQRTKVPDSGAITSIAVAPNVSSDGTHFIGTEKRGILGTVDGGASYVAATKGLPERPNRGLDSITSLSISPNYATDSTIFATTWYEAVFRSTDAGKTWAKNSTGVTWDKQADRFNAPHFGHLRIAGGAERNRTIFLAGFDGLFKSTDGGNTWMQMETRSLKPVVGLALSPEYDNDSTIAIATFGGGAYVSHDQGNAWRVANMGLKRTHLLDVAFSPSFASDNTMFTISNFAFYRSTDRGKNWNRIELSHRGGTLRRTLVSRIARRIYRFHPPALLAAVALANRLDRLFRSREEKHSSWITFLEMIAVSPDFVSDNTIYFGTRYQGVFRSEDGGITWSPIWKPAGGRIWISSLVVSPDFSSDNILYAGVSGQGIYKTEDRGNTWQPANNGLPAIVRRYATTDSLLLAISPSYGTDRTVFAGSVKGLFKTVDGGESWQELEALRDGSEGYVKAVAVSPDYQNDSTLIVSIKGRGVVKSTDGGKTFTTLSPELIDNNHSLRLIRFSPAYSIDRTIYGASQEELLQSNDSGNTWRLIARPIRYGDREEIIVYQGKWQTVEGKDFSATTATFAIGTGDKATFRFVGTGVAWIGTRSDDQGIGKVYIDGALTSYVDQFSLIPEHMVKLYSISGLTRGPHTIEIEVTNTKNPLSRGIRVAIDAFDVFAATPEEVGAQ